MTDEGQLGHPMDNLEMAEAMRGLATSARSFYDQAIEEGFTNAEAWKLLIAWMHAVAGGKAAS